MLNGRIHRGSLTSQKTPLATLQSLIPPLLHPHKLTPQSKSPHNQNPNTSKSIPQHPHPKPQKILTIKSITPLQYFKNPPPKLGTLSRTVYHLPLDKKKLALALNRSRSLSLSLCSLSLCSLTSTSKCKTKRGTKLPNNPRNEASPGLQYTIWLLTRSGPCLGRSPCAGLVCLALIEFLRIHWDVENIDQMLELEVLFHAAGIDDSIHGGSSSSSSAGRCCSDDLLSPW